MPESYASGWTINCLRVGRSQKKERSHGVSIIQVSGLQLAVPGEIYSGDQVVYLDFDGAENVTYNNEALALSISDITVSDSGFTGEQISGQ